MGSGSIQNKFAASYNTFIKEHEGHPVYNWRCKSWLYDDQAVNADHHSKIRDKLKCTLIQKGVNGQLTLHITGISKNMQSQRIRFGFYDCRGRLLYATSSVLSPGTPKHTVQFDRIRIGVLSSGVHVIHIRIGNLQQTVKSVIMR